MIDAVIGDRDEGKWTADETGKESDAETEKVSDGAEETGVEEENENGRNGVDLN